MISHRFHNIAINRLTTSCGKFFHKIMSTRKRKVNNPHISTPSIDVSNDQPRPERKKTKRTVSKSSSSQPGNSEATLSDIMEAVKVSQQQTQQLVARIEILEQGRSCQPETVDETNVVHQQGGSACVDNPSLSFNSFAVPVGARLPLKTKLAITSNNFIDFQGLLRPGEGTSEGFLSLGDDGKLKLVANSPKSKRSVMD